MTENDEERYEMWESVGEGESSMISGTMADRGVYPEYPPRDVDDREMRLIVAFHACNWVEASQLRNDILGFGPYQKMVESEGPRPNWPYRRYVKLVLLQWKVPLERRYYQNIQSTLDRLWEELTDDDKERLRAEVLLAPVHHNKEKGHE